MYITKWKKPNWKDHILYDSHYITFWKRQNNGDCKKLPEVNGREEWIRGAQRVFRTVKLFCMIL